jgi:hypothetical protein
VSFDNKCPKKWSFFDKTEWGVAKMTNGLSELSIDRKFDICYSDREPICKGTFTMVLMTHCGPLRWEIGLDEGPENARSQ